MPTLGPTLDGVLGGVLRDAVGSSVGGAVAGGAQDALDTKAADDARVRAADSGTARLLMNAKRRGDGAWVVAGQPPMNDDAFKALVERSVQTDIMGGIPLDGLKEYLDNSGIQFSAAGGSFRVTGVPGAGGASISPGGAGAGGTPNTGGTPLPTPNPTSSGGGSYGAGGGYAPGGGGGGGGSSFGGAGGRPAGPAPWDTEPRLQGGGSTTSLPTGSPGTTAINPNAPLGLDPTKGAPPGTRGGTYGSDRFAGPGSLLEGLNPNSSLNDVIMNIVKRQEANRDAALKTYGGAYDEAKNDPVLQASRGRALDVLNNPFSLDDQTISRILGAQASTIGQNTARLKSQSADRAAAMGVGRGGLEAANQDRLDINAVKSLGDAQRGLLIEQATRKPKELQASLASAGDFGSRDVAQRTGIATGAADSVYGQTSILGDALLSGVLMGGQSPGINVALPYQGTLLKPGGNVVPRY